MINSLTGLLLILPIGAVAGDNIADPDSCQQSLFLSYTLQYHLCYTTHYN
ncbi:MAG: hypothetical protein KZQ83_19645 [gamma proteobacterium symbiont of Taylorina sp.]|nr:hypothetical protein [gamma proteobacterium symbiont of Taylorina sp.]